MRCLGDKLASLVRKRYEYLSLLPLSLADQARLPRFHHYFPVLSCPDDEILPVGCDEIDNLVVVVSAVEHEDGFPLGKTRAHELDAVKRIRVCRKVAWFRLGVEDVVNGHLVLARCSQRSDAAYPVAVANRTVDG